MVYRGPGLLFTAYLIVGVLVAAGVIGNDNYFRDLNTLKELLEAILAVLLWPLVLLDVNFHHLGSEGGSSGGGGGRAK